MKKIKNLFINISISIITTLFLFFILEILFRVFFPQYLDGSWSTISKKGYLLNKASWTAQHQFSERDIRYYFNQYHQREDDIKHDQYKVLSLGDSFTFGWLLEKDKTYLNLLQDNCNDMFGKNNIQIINGGAGGWGLADYSDYLEEFGDQIIPNMVVVFFNTGDIARSLNRNIYFNPNSKLNAFKMALNNVPLYQWLLEHSHVTQWFKIQMVTISLNKNTPENKGEEHMTIPKSSIKDPNLKSNAIEIGQELFGNINNWCIARNIPFVVLTTGWHFDYYSDEKNAAPESFFLDQSRQFFSENHIPFFEITPAIMKETEGNLDSFIINGDGHPNEDGAKLIAKHSWEKLHPIIEKYYSN